MKACSSSLLRSLMSMAGPFVPTVLSYVARKAKARGSYVACRRCLDLLWPSASCSYELLLDYEDLALYCRC